MNQPICSIEAERLLIGSVLQNGVLLFEVRAALLPRDFFDAQLRRIYSVLCEMVDAGREVDQNSFLQYVTDRNLIGEMLLATALDCASLALRRASVAEYIAEIREKSQKRSVAKLGYELSERAYSSLESAQDLIADADRQLLEIAAESVGQEATLEQQSCDAMARVEAERRGERPSCFRIGIPLLDVFAGGLGVGELTIVAGRPSMGKSCSVAQAIITNCAAGFPCHVVSIEMTSDELLRRIWAALSEVPFGRLSDPTYLNDEDFAKVRRAMLKMSSWPLVIDDAPVITTDQLIARAKVVKRRIDTKVLAVDYLQRLTFSGPKKDLYMEVGEAAKRLAEFAKAEQIAVMLLSSLTEKTGSGANIPPSLADLRQSGDIQYHAHKAYLIHRDREEESGISPKTQIIVAKNRHGRTGVVNALFNSSSLLFEDVAGGRSHVM
ncbi:MAG TPA: replicative DNA helicase [Edaphobacter sp.]|nr:replicative DNA helicase [Edaphobacter sp.]